MAAGALSLMVILAPSLRAGVADDVEGFQSQLEEVLLDSLGDRLDAQDWAALQRAERILPTISNRRTRNHFGRTPPRFCDGRNQERHPGSLNCAGSGAQTCSMSLFSRCWNTSAPVALPARRRGAP